MKSRASCSLRDSVSVGTGQAGCVLRAGLKEGLKDGLRTLEVVVDDVDEEVFIHDLVN